jgi:hypothetical protein
LKSTFANCEAFGRSGSGVAEISVRFTPFHEQFPHGTNYSYLGWCFLTVATTAVKKTISLPPELARDAEETARAEGKTLSAVIQDALRLSRAARLKREFKEVQGYWSRKAREKGILSEEDLRRYLEE